MDIGSLTFGTAIVGAVAGLTGTILGIINTLINVRRDRVRLRVRLSQVITVNLGFEGRTTYAIETLNLSEFPVVITDIGLDLTKKEKASLSTVQGLEPKGKLPLRLEPRTSYQKLFLASSVDDLRSRMMSVYSQTECGVTAKGKIAVSRNRRSPR